MRCVSEVRAAEGTSQVAAERLSRLGLDLALQLQRIRQTTYNNSDTSYLQSIELELTTLGALFSLGGSGRINPAFDCGALASRRRKLSKTLSPDVSNNAQSNRPQNLHCGAHRIHFYTDCGRPAHFGNGSPAYGLVFVVR